MVAIERWSLASVCCVKLFGYSYPMCVTKLLNLSSSLTTRYSIQINDENIRIYLMHSKVLFSEDHLESLLNVWWVITPNQRMRYIKRAFLCCFFDADSFLLRKIRARFRLGNSSSSPLKLVYPPLLIYVLYNVIFFILFRLFCRF